MFSKSDYVYMSRALDLAKRGQGSVDPNPCVGCVLVKNDAIVGEGWHVKAGSLHAEVNALTQAASRAHGSTAYVTLEPCSFHGRTPPCTDALIDAGVSKVIYACDDPNPKVSGAGRERMIEAGLEVLSGLLAEQSTVINQGFMSRFQRSRPWVVSKVAASLDGKTALANGKSQWITGKSARRLVHKLRSKASAILTGSGTVLADDPSLTIRHVSSSRQPSRIVLDTRLQVSPNAKLFQDPGDVIIFHGPDHQKDGLQDAGARLIASPTAGDHLELYPVFEHLAALEINTVMVEAGSTLNGALLSQGLIDELVIFFAPCLLGRTARNMFALPAFEDLESRVNLDITDVRKVGDDWMLRARVLTAG